MRTFSARGIGRQSAARTILAGAVFLAIGFGLPLLPAVGDTVTNPISSVPICVDGGLTSPGEYSGSQALAYISGSLYQTARNDPDRNAQLFYAIAQDEESNLKRYDLFVLAEYLKRTNAAFAPGEFVADMHFPIVLSGTPLPNFTLQFRGGLNPAKAPFDVFADLDGDGIADRRASQIGIDAAVGFGATPLSATLHLILELKVPLSTPAGFGAPFPAKGQNGIYSPGPATWSTQCATDVYSAPGVPVIGQQSRANVVINPGSLTADSKAVPIFFALDLGNLIQLSKNGNVPVAVTTTDFANALDIDPSTVRLRAAGSTAPGAQPIKSNTRDLNGSGRPDLVLYFTTADLQAAGGFDLNTTDAELTGSTFGGDAVFGKGTVRIQP
jgi:hypothetical protein